MVKIDFSNVNGIDNRREEDSERGKIGNKKVTELQETKKSAQSVGFRDGIDSIKQENNQQQQILKFFSKESLLKYIKEIIPEELSMETKKDIKDNLTQAQITSIVRGVCDIYSSEYSLNKMKHIVDTFKNK